VAAVFAIALLSMWTSLRATRLRREAHAAPANPATATAAPRAAARAHAPAADEPVCGFKAGAPAPDTLGLNPQFRRSIPITHVIVLVQENRSFDHYFGQLAAQGQPDAEPLPPGASNPDRDGRPVPAFHLPSTCVPVDPPHQWSSMHAHWNNGRMDGFVTSAAGRDDDDDDAGRYAMGYYNGRDLPFYYWLASTFSLSDRYFSAAMGGTWPNRQILYTGTAQSQNAPTSQLTGAHSLFDALDEAGVAWNVFTDGPPRQDCIGWKKDARGVQPMSRFFAELAAGTLPAVSFIDPNKEDEHPPADVQRGEGWSRLIYTRLVQSPLWPRLAAFLTYDEGGGFFDHVPPPPACAPSADRAEYDRRGTRVPLIVVSPWARAHAVSHHVSDHASILRFIELKFGLPALSDRDANADALLDRFDFTMPQLLQPPPAPRSGHGGCKPALMAGR
jgi:phospholipase C